MIPSLPPLEILEGDAYEQRDVKCARCGYVMPNAPWPHTSTEIRHRPGCSACGSRSTYPVTVKAVIGEVVELGPSAPMNFPPLVFSDEKERQRALQTVEDLIQRTREPAPRILYLRQKERILKAELHPKSPA